MIKTLISDITDEKYVLLEIALYWREILIFSLYWASETTQLKQVDLTRAIVLLFLMKLII